MSDGEDDATLLGASARSQLSRKPVPPWERFSEPPSDYNLHRWQAETAGRDPSDIRRRAG